MFSPGTFRALEAFQQVLSGFRVWIEEAHGLPPFGVEHRFRVQGFGLRASVQRVYGTRFGGVSSRVVEWLPLRGGRGLVQSYVNPAPYTALNPKP